MSEVSVLIPRGVERPAKRRPAPSFKTLLGERAWARLAGPIRQRFGPGAVTGDFTGLARLHASRFGALIAALMIPFGRPLPTLTGGCEAQVTIRPGPQGAVWDRAYRKAGGAWQHVRSVKRQEGGALYECAGPIWMRLRLEERGGALAFISTGFFLALGRLRLRLPDWLTPGQLTVTHTDHGEGRFAFALTCRHPLFGAVFDQTVQLCDTDHEEFRP
jgi:hypothetical protein